MGTLPGIRKQHLQRYFAECVVRWNRRRSTRQAFDTLLDMVTELPHLSMRDFVPK